MWFTSLLAAVLALLAPAPLPTPETPPPAAEHTGWDVGNRTRLDVDGDGTDEVLLVRRPPRGDGAPELAVHWADGRVEAGRVHGRFFDDVVRGYAADRRPGEELLVRDVVSYRWSVWGHRDGRWLRLPVRRPELLRDSIGGDGHGYATLFDGARLLSYRSVDRFDVGYDYAFPPAPVYAVDTWRWVWRHGHLAPRPTGRRCVSEDDANRFVPCS